MKYNLIVFEYFCGLVFLIGIVTSSETGDEIPQNNEEPSRRFSNADAAAVASGYGSYGSATLAPPYALSGATALDMGTLLNAFKALSSSYSNSLSNSNYFGYGTNPLPKGFGSFAPSPSFPNLTPSSFYPFPYVGGGFDNGPSAPFLISPEINGYRDARERAIAQALCRQHLSSIFGNGVRCANLNSQTPYPYIPSYIKPIYSRLPIPLSIFRPRSSEVIIDTTCIPNTVPVINRPKIMLNTEAVRQEDGSIKAVIEAILEARRRFEMNE